ncbi:hypothetical protein [Silvimonas sp.]|uniref:hypothetical protein n=1 Tax=Silvimonas sp. TaxID=2650811 RepID=UPI00283FA814|nr:hypothetical protein [Silvimonas sp.]MDR3429661.1 hypothetical protein [Silvimonas sp.]
MFSGFHIRLVRGSRAHIQQHTASRFHDGLNLAQADKRRSPKQTMPGDINLFEVRGPLDDFHGCQKSIKTPAALISPPATTQIRCNVAAQ